MARDAQGRFMAGTDTRNLGASMSRRSMASWMPYLGSPRTDWSEHERNTLVARSRDAFRNQLIARAALTRINSNVIGTGLRLQSRPNPELLGMEPIAAKELGGLIEREFGLWAESAACDAEWTLNFYQQQGLVQLSVLQSGDVFVATPMVRRPDSVYSLVLQHIEGDRVGDPYGSINRNIFQGVETDALGAPMRYHIADKHPADDGIIRYTPVDVFGRNTGRRRVMHIFDKERPGQMRGVPILAPVLEPLKKLDRYGDAELMAAVVSAMFTVFVTKNPESGGAHPLANAIGANGATNAKENDISMGNAAIVDLNPGEDVEFANPGRPNENYAPFFTEFCRQAGAALELPVDELLLSYRDSYSAARAAMLQGWRMYKRRRATIDSMFCQPAFAVWFDEAVAKGRIPVKGYADPVRRAAYTRAVWRGPARGAIDELKEGQAAEKRIQIGVSNLEKEAAELGGEDWWDIAIQRGIERTERAKLGLTDPSDPKPAPNSAAPSNAGTEDKSEV
jgi:lambda family phage portal protein